MIYIKTSERFSILCLQVGRHCRGRLPINLALNTEAKAFFSINPDLESSIESSKLASPLLASNMIHSPLTFVSCEARNWHYRNVSHVLLHNHVDGGVSADDCRMIAAKLAASPSFMLLVTTEPLPFQHHLIHIGDSELPLPGAASDVHLAPVPGGYSMMPKSQEKSNIVALDQNDTLQRMHPEASSSFQASDDMLGSSLDAQQLLEAKGRRVYMYSTSYEAAPTGTLAALYCVSGVCCLPSQQAWIGRMDSSSLRGGMKPSLPPLAAHTYSS